MQSSSLIIKPMLASLLVLVVFTGCVYVHEFEIQRLDIEDTQTQTINGRALTMRADYFLVETNVFSVRSIRDSIANYVSGNDSFKNKFHYYEMKFYKKTSSINAVELQKLPENLRWKLFRDETPIANYDFQFGNLMP